MRLHAISPTAAAHLLLGFCLLALAGAVRADDRRPPPDQRLLRNEQAPVLLAEASDGVRRAEAAGS